MDQTRFSVFIDFLSLLGFCTTPHSAITNPNPKLLTLNVTVNLTLYLTLTLILMLSPTLTLTLTVGVEVLVRKSRKALFRFLHKSTTDFTKMVSIQLAPTLLETLTRCKPVL